MCLTPCDHRPSTCLTLCVAVCVWSHQVAEALAREADERGGAANKGPAAPVEQPVAETLVPMDEAHTTCRYCREWGMVGRRCGWEFVAPADTVVGWIYST
jgi:hypothetical protein